MKGKIYAVGFDGTLNLADKYPLLLGEPNNELFDFLKQRKRLGDRIILYTRREGDLLEEAVEYCKRHGLEFDAVNSNIDDAERRGAGKVAADYYIDDRNLYFQAVHSPEIREIHGDLKTEPETPALPGLIVPHAVGQLKAQPELPDLRNNTQRREWLRNYKDWGLWYEDAHIGCRYYKYDFKNGARLIAEAYRIPKTKWQDAHDDCYLHLVGGPEPPINTSTGCGKWKRHETYSKYPDSETELSEFLKYMQRRQ